MFMKTNIEVGLIVCNSGASNSGMIAGKASLKVVKNLEDWVSICSLPALANNVPRQIHLVKSLKHLIVIDGCHQQCAKKIADKLGLRYDAYVNLEYDLGIEKKGPFTTFKYNEEDIKRVTKYIYRKTLAIMDGNKIKRD
jgi:uncharacterized metal-binding protein